MTLTLFGSLQIDTLLAGSIAIHVDLIGMCLSASTCIMGVCILVWLQTPRQAKRLGP